MYSISKDLTVDAGSGISPIPVGINENVKFSGLEKKVDKNGNSYLSFNFTDPEGNVLTHNEFEINPQYVTPKEGESKEDAVNRRVNSMLVRIKHICTQFISADQFVVSGTDWSSFCTNLVQLMQNRNYSKALRLKVVYNYRDYASLPNYTPFVETMETSPSKLRISKNDKLVKEETKAVAEVANTDDDLPF